MLIDSGQRPCWNFTIYIYLFLYLQIYSIDEDEKLTPSLEILLPRDLADGFVNNKRENYRFK